MGSTTWWNILLSRRWRYQSCKEGKTETVLAGLTPTALEWDMKLWWVHLESLVATLMAYRHTTSQQHWDNFSKVYNYTFSKVGRHVSHRQCDVHLCLAVPAGWRGDGRLPGQAGQRQDGLQGRPVQRMLPRPQSSDGVRGDHQATAQ